LIETGNAYRIWVVKPLGRTTRRFEDNIKMHLTGTGSME
jgi:hypothetical protein